MWWLLASPVVNRKRDSRNQTETNAERQKYTIILTKMHRRRQRQAETSGDKEKTD